MTNMLRVLLIDDEELEYKLVKLMFRDVYKAEHSLEYAQNLHEAETILEQRSFDIILLDDKLSDGSTSLQNVPFIKSLTKSTPLCIVSKSIDAEHLRDKTILDVYDIVDKFNLRQRLELGFVA